MNDDTHSPCRITEDLESRDERQRISHSVPSAMVSSVSGAPTMK